MIKIIITLSFILVCFALGLSVFITYAQRCSERNIALVKEMFNLYGFRALFLIHELKKYNIYHVVRRHNGINRILDVKNPVNYISRMGNIYGYSINPYNYKYYSNMRAFWRSWQKRIIIDESHMDNVIYWMNIARMHGINRINGFNKIWLWKRKSGQNC